MHIRFYLLPFLLLPCFAVFSQKSLLLEDKAYEPQIKTILCYSGQPGEGNLHLPAVTNLDAQNLILEFDDLREQHDNYYVKLIHCNYDWSKSTLMDLDFMREYNEFQINDYSFSINTHVPYLHYRFAVLPVRIPGNYVVMVYRDGNRNDLILTKRIIVFDPKLDLVRDDGISGMGNLQNSNQALNFIVNYGRMDILNPMGSIHVTIRQNQRWDNAKEDVKPSFIREDINQLEYRFFDMDKTFQGGNEFRFVDFRSLNYPGQNCLRLDKGHKPYDLFVNIDRPRLYQAYAQYQDMNGGFLADNTDYRQEPWISANYLYVNFALESPAMKGDVYVIGAFNGWVRNEENKLTFSHGMYTKRILLKQGLYDYAYWTDTPEPSGNQIEGNLYQTENLYEVLVYYRAFQPNADLLVGYFVLPVNAR